MLFFLMNQRKFCSIIRIFIVQQINMISEGSCDTEDWSYDAEYLVLYHSN